MSKRVVNLFWFAFFCDGFLSFLDELISTKFALPGLSTLCSLAAATALLMSLLAAGIFVFSARAPKRVVVPMILFLWWVDLYKSLPLQAWDSPWRPFLFPALQSALAMGILFLFRAKGAPWHTPFLLEEDRPGFRWKHAILAGVSMGVTLLVGIFASLALGLAAKIENATGGYVRLKPDGIYVIERKFHLGDHEVWLVGMMHIARHEFYQNVLPQADPKMPSIVLAEGVTDRKKLLKGTMGYAHLAKILQLDSQEDCEYTKEVRDGLAAQEGMPSSSNKELPRPRQDGLNFKRADIDVESFSPKTIAALLAVREGFQSENLQQVQTALLDPQSPLQDKAVRKQVVQDILYSRNDKLVFEIDSSLKIYKRVIVPWGAAHLSGVQSWLLSHNFVQTEEVERKAIPFW